jgi:hypothetical protein
MQLVHRLLMAHDSHIRSPDSQLRELTGSANTVADHITVLRST